MLSLSFKKQKETGTVTITDDRMTRFWITLEEGVQFVINCIENMQGGEIFVPKISSMKMIDLADAIAPDAQKKIIGIRAGEKLHEILLSKDEARHSVEKEDSFVIVPEDNAWDDKEWKISELPEDFEYASNTNTEWITEKELKEMIE